MNILDTIVDYKRNEIKERKELYPIKLLEKSIFFKSPTVSLKQYLLRKDKFGIIAEIKRKSPSKDVINKYVDVEKTSIGYMQAGASALSILTDTNFFDGTNEDLTIARKFNYCPILRKDFILDEYQKLHEFAASLQLEVLIEVHNEEELKKIELENKIIGVNNRDLTTFTTNIQTSIDLSRFIPDNCVKVSESGISNPSTVLSLREVGFKGFLIGEHFMRSAAPELACKKFIEELSSNNVN